MDNLTHSLMAFTLAETPLRRAGRGTTVTLLIASNAPDIDVLTAVTGGGLSYLAAHRGPTHGVLGLIVLPLCTATVIRLAVRWFKPSARDETTFAKLLGVAFVGVLSHCLMDLPTSYGTRLLSPFSNTWYAVDWLPIIDVYVWLFLAAGIGILRLRLAPPARAAAVVLVIVAGHYALRAVAHQAALGRAGGHAPVLQLARWPTAGSEKQIAAIPTFQSPFRWRVVRPTTAGYELAEIDLFSGGAVGPYVLYRHEQDRWTERARLTRAVRIFLAFARFPIVQVSKNDDQTVTVRWQDMRFTGRWIGRGEQPVSQPSPLAVTVRLNRDGRVIEERMGN